MMQTRDSSATHSSNNGRELKFTPASDKLFGHGERHSLTSWRLDETYSRLKGQWKYWDRAVAKADDAVDFLLTAKDDRKAAVRPLRKAIDQFCIGKKITLDNSEKRRVAGVGPQAKYLNNIFEQNHRGGQTTDPTHAGIQLVLVCGNYSHRKRTNAHVPQGPNKLPRYTAPGATIFFVDQLERLKISILLERSKTFRQNAAISHFETRPCH